MLTPAPPATLPGTRWLPGMGTPPGAGTSGQPIDEQLSHDYVAEHGIWLCGGGELPAPLLAALTGQAPWAPPASTEAAAPSTETAAPGTETAAPGTKAPAPGTETAAPGTEAPALRRAAGDGESCQARANGSVSAGFAQGAVLDGLAPGPELAMFLGDAVSGASRAADCYPGPAAGGLAALDDAALTGVLRGWRRLSSWAAAMEHAAVAELARRRIAEAETAGCWAEEASRYAAAEIAAALTLTRTSADTLLGRALALQDLPDTAAALSAGRIDVPRATIIADGTACLDQRLSLVADAELAAVAPTMTTGQLRAAVARVVIAAGPAAAEERRRQAEKQARVEHQPEASGVTAMLAGRDLPAAESAAAMNRITALAAALKRDGATGGIDFLRAQVFLGLLLGRPVAAVAPESEPGGGPEPNCGPFTGPPAGAPLVSAGDAGTRWPVLSSETSPAWTSPAWTSPAWTSPAASINLTVPLTTWLGLADAPGDLAGYGPVTAAISRQILANAGAGPAARWCLTITDGEGTVIGHGCATQRQVGVLTGNRSPRDGSRNTGRWKRTINIQALAIAECDHWRESARYELPRSLRHIIEIRDQTCSFPGCRIPSVKCDKDHTVPYDRGGRTCECNLAPLCRFHHKLKQALGWRLEQPEPGVLIWTAPSGWKYTVTQAHACSVTGEENRLRRRP